MGLYGSPQLGSFADRPRRPRSRWRWLKILFFTILGIVGAFVALIVGVAILIAAHVIPEPTTVTTTPSAPAASAVQCAPAPCAAYAGVTVLVSNVNRNYSVPADAFTKPDPGYHLVRLEVTFIDQSGEHEVSPYDLQLQDALGYKKTASYFGTGCESGSGASLAPGGKVGPMSLCFQAGGSASGPLSLLWLPPDLATKQTQQWIQTGKITALQGLEIRLP